MRQSDTEAQAGHTHDPWAEVRALAGARFAGMGRGCVWLRSGERYLGDVEATDLRFTLVSGLNMDLKLAELDRLVMAKSDREGKWPDGIAALIEMEDGERLALADLAASLPMIAVWGPWDLRIADLVRMIAPTTDATSGLAMFRDGTCAPAHAIGRIGIGVAATVWHEDPHA
jgi:hypothetical protein